MRSGRTISQDGRNPANRYGPGNAPTINANRSIDECPCLFGITSSDPVVYLVVFTSTRHPPGRTASSSGHAPMVTSG